MVLDKRVIEDGESGHLARLVLNVRSVELAVLGLGVVSASWGGRGRSRGGRGGRVLADGLGLEAEGVGDGGQGGGRGLGGGVLEGGLERGCGLQVESLAHHFLGSGCGVEWRRGRGSLKNINVRVRKSVSRNGRREERGMGW